jgi:hypothetical protein
MAVGYSIESGKFLLNRSVFMGSKNLPLAFITVGMGKISRFCRNTQQALVGLPVARPTLGYSIAEYHFGPWSDHSTR